MMALLSPDCVSSKDCFPLFGDDASPLPATDHVINLLNLVPSFAAFTPPQPLFCFLRLYQKTPYLYHQHMFSVYPI